MSISEAASAVGASPGTRRCWEREGKILSAPKVGKRRYTLAMLKPPMAYQSPVEKKTVA